MFLHLDKIRERRQLEFTYSFLLKPKHCSSFCKSLKGKWFVPNPVCAQVLWRGRLEIIWLRNDMLSDSDSITNRSMTQTKNRMPAWNISSYAMGRCNLFRQHPTFNYSTQITATWLQLVQIPAWFRVCWLTNCYKWLEITRTGVRLMKAGGRPSVCSAPLSINSLQTLPPSVKKLGPVLHAWYGFPWLP